MSRSKNILLLLLVAFSSIRSQHSDTAKAVPKFNTSREIELLRRIKGADIRSWMNLKIDPCKNFYNHVCGKWIRIYATQASVKGSITGFSELNSEMERRAKKFIENAEDSRNGIQRKISDFYKSCVNTKTSPSHYRKDLLKLLKEFDMFSFQKGVDEGTPHDAPFNWWSTIAKIYQRFGWCVFLDISPDYHFKSRNRTMIFIGQPNSLLSEEDTDIDISKQLITLFEANSKDVESLVENVFALDEKITNAITRYTGDFVEENFSLRYVSEFSTQYQQLLDVESFLKIAFNLTELPAQIYVENGEYFDDLNEIFSNTKRETVMDYILWQLIKNFVIDIDDSETIESVCVDKTKFYFAQYFEHVIYQEFRSSSYEMEVYELWHQIKAVFRDDLQNETTYHWMPRATREEAIKKLDNMQLKINSYDEVNFEKFFDHLKITSMSYVDNLSNLMELFESWRGRQLQIRSNSIEDINLEAYTPVYSNENNAVTIPVATFLPFRVWHTAYPKFVLYSNLGNILAHELIHAYDDSNRQYDAVGNANKWWDDNSIRVYNENRLCFQTQYQRYTIGGNRMRNMTDQSENISDNASVRIAFTAYERWLTKMRSEQPNAVANELILNLPYNTEELFFISFGQSYCEAINRKTLFKTMEDETHAPDMLRVLVPLTNYPRFSEVFKCASKTPMNPKAKCKLY